MERQVLDDAALDAAAADIEGLAPRDAADLAASRETTPESLVALTVYKSPLVLSAIAANPNAPAEAFDRMARTFSGVRIVAASEVAPPEILSDLVRRNRHGPVTAIVAANPSFPPALESRLAKSKSWHVRAGLASNPAASAGAVARLANDRRWGVRYHAARSPNLPGRSAEKLADDIAPVRLQLAANDTIDPDLAKTLAADRDPWVSGRALANPRTAPEQFEAVAEPMDRPAWVLRGIADHPDCSEDLADQLAAWLVLGGGDGDPAFDPITCEGNPGRADEHDTLAFRRIGIEAEADGTDQRLHPLFLTRTHQRTPTASTLLAEAADDPEPQVRATLLGRWDDIPLRTLRHVKKYDPSLGVVRSADRQVEKQKSKQSNATGLLVAVAACLALAVVFGRLNADDTPIPYTDTDILLPSISFPPLSTISLPPVDFDIQRTETTGGATVTLTRLYSWSTSYIVNVEAAAEPIAVTAVATGPDGTVFTQQGELPLRLEAGEGGGVQLYGTPDGRIDVVVDEGGKQQRLSLPLPRPSIDDILSEPSFPQLTGTQTTGTQTTGTQITGTQPTSRP